MRISSCGKLEQITHPRHHKCWSNKTQILSISNLNPFTPSPWNFLRREYSVIGFFSAVFPLICISCINEFHLVCLRFIENNRICAFLFISLYWPEISINACIFCLFPSSLSPFFWLLLTSSSLFISLWLSYFFCLLFYSVYWFLFSFSFPVLVLYLTHPSPLTFILDAVRGGEVQHIFACLPTNRGHL